ncbi:homoserine kinase [Erythrobacter sp. YT30]|uniref:homoserine kinase n=1 Tax=Erythrobacter sp. YT30 TaxID=1735012 RepID=UPI00076C0F16|nr:homoserine kinase [Erythrobacter sp. YT30]KWV90378.1 homoserine kinase [Erythrobacter sp. YT30]
MAVYTHLSAEDLSELISHYDVGELVSAKGIAEGVSNSNWLIETRKGTANSRYILTMYERRIELDDLPYFLGLLDHLSAKGCPVPRTIHDETGAEFRMVEGKAVALIEFLPGVSPTRPTPDQTRALGATLAQMHLASADFPLSRRNTMGFADNLAVLEKCGADGLASIHPDLPDVLGPARNAAALDLSALPKAQVHADLFPDNVLMLDDKVTGMIDFYFACTDCMALDIAVTHAAWCFDPDTGDYLSNCGTEFLNAYESIREITQDERALFAEIAKGACLRFVASRAEDWLETPNDALVTRKDPVEFVRRWRFYDEHASHLFA